MIFWVITQRLAVISYRRFRTTCWFRLQRSRIQKQLEQSSSHLHLGESLESLIDWRGVWVGPKTFFVPLRKQKKINLPECN